MKAKRVERDRRFKADRRCMNYAVIFPERRKIIRRNIPDRRGLFKKSLQELI